MFIFTLDETVNVFLGETYISSFNCNLFSFHMFGIYFLLSHEWNLSDLLLLVKIWISNYPLKNFLIIQKCSRFGLLIK